MATLFRSFFFWIIFGLFLSIYSPPVSALDLDIDLGLGPTLLSQEEFKDLSEEMGLALSYLPLSPAESLGVLGFDIGAEVTAANIREDHSYWTKVTEDPPSQIILPKLHIQKGLPFGFDIGAVYSKVPQSNVSMVGGELKWAFISGNAVWPAVAIRGSYTRLLGVDDLDLETIGADLSISKGLAFVTPYAGIGQVWIRSKEKVSSLDLEKESLSLTKGFIGVKISLLIINFVAEADFSKIPLYSGRINIGF
ncbi:MAG: hypothetical protein MCM46_16880 [Candidatus Manganitrophus sp. SB1]|nr:hypothetical protein [Candidatus Manganitrophus morganii]